MTQHAEPDLLINVDLDGVIVDCIGGWRKLWNAKYPDRQIVADPTEFMLEVAYSNFGTEEEITEIFYTPEFFTDLDPIPGAIDAVKQMVENGIDVFLCSSPSRLSTSHSEKAEWVETYMGSEWLNRLILTRDKTLVQGDFLIDDKPVITGIYQPCWEHIVFDAPYNRGEETANKFRITWRTWPSLLMYSV